MRRTRWIGAAAMIAVATTAMQRGIAGKPNLVDDFGGVGFEDHVFDPWDLPDPETPVPFPEPTPPLPDFPGDDPFDGLPEPPLPPFPDDDLTLDFPMSDPPTAKVEQKTKKPPAVRRVRFVAMRARRKDYGYGYKPFARALWAPFRWETTTGLPNANHVSGVAPGASFGTQLVTEDPGPTDVSLLASKSADGLAVSATYGAANFGPVDFPGAKAVDLAIEADATKIVFYARAQGATDYVKLGESTFTQTVALFPALAAYAVTKEAVVGFDRWRVASSAPAPGTLSPSGQALELAYKAWDWQLDELHRVDAAPSLTHVRIGVAGSIDFLAQAAALVKGGAKRKIAAALATAKATLKAIDKNKGGPRETIVKDLKRALVLDLATRKSLAGT